MDAAHDHTTDELLRCRVVQGFSKLLMLAGAGGGLYFAKEQGLLDAFLGVPAGAKVRAEVALASDLIPWNQSTMPSVLFPPRSLADHCGA